MPRRDLTLELASRLHYATPAPVLSLVADLLTTRTRLRKAADDLVNYGVCVLPDDDAGWTIDRDTYPMAERLARTYDDPAPVEARF